MGSYTGDVEKAKENLKLFQQTFDTILKDIPGGYPNSLNRRVIAKINIALRNNKVKL